VSKDDWIRFKVIYIAKKDGKRRTTEVTSTGKLKAGAVVLDTLAKEVLKVIPLKGI